MKRTQLAELAAEFGGDLGAARAFLDAEGLRVDADGSVHEREPGTIERLLKLALSGAAAAGNEYEYIRSRPRALRALICQFPPVCRVVALSRLRVPRPGRVGRIVAYLDDGQLGVADEDEWLQRVPIQSPIMECRPNQLTVVQYDGNKNRAWAAAVLDGVDAPARNPGLDMRVEGERVNESEVVADVAAKRPGWSDEQVGRFVRAALDFAVWNEGDSPGPDAPAIIELPATRERPRRSRPGPS